MNNEAVTEYARIFDGSNPNWHPNEEYNLIFVQSHLNYMHDRVQARGHLFLNEVHDMLGFPRTTAGAIRGWMPETGQQMIVVWQKVLPGKGFLIDFVNTQVIYDLIEDPPRPFARPKITNSEMRDRRATINRINRNRALRDAHLEFRRRVADLGDN